MPIVERDPWRLQYFEGVPCPEELFIPTEDPDSYRLFPQHRWVYNKLRICESQGLGHAPHGIAPERYPVFSKPIYNLRGMGTGSRILESAEDYAEALAPGHMWMELCEGDHVSTDAAVVDGEPVWWRHTVGVALGQGMFDYWIVQAEHRPAIESYCGRWLRENLESYTGVVNLETIGGRIIECHLRLSDQWVDLNGAGWVAAIVGLYQHGYWAFDDRARRTGYSVVLFGAHGPHYHDVGRDLVQELLAEPEISSVQITFHEGKPPESHPMPPGGFRLAIVNCWDLEAGLGARRRLAVGWGVANPPVR